MVEILKLYAQICCESLTSCLNQAVQDRTVSEATESEVCHKINVQGIDTLPSQDNSSNKIDSTGKLILLLSYTFTHILLNNRQNL